MKWNSTFLKSKLIKRSAVILAATAVCAGTSATAFAADAVVTVNPYSSLNIREADTTDSEVLGQLERGDSVTILAEGDEWTQIQAGDVTGYVKNDYIATGEEAETAAAEIAEEEANGYNGYSESDVDLLAALITCEAGGECYEGQVAVGAVVMNRVNSSAWPNTIYDVIYQSGQFSPAMSGWLGSVLSNGSAFSSCYEAAYEALSGSDPTGGCMYFHAGGGSGLTIGNQTFY